VNQNKKWDKTKQQMVSTETDFHWEIVIRCSEFGEIDIISSWQACEKIF